MSLLEFVFLISWPSFDGAAQASISSSLIVLVSAMDTLLSTPFIRPWISSFCCSVPLLFSALAPALLLSLRVCCKNSTALPVRGTQRRPGVQNKAPILHRRLFLKRGYFGVALHCTLLA